MKTSSAWPEKITVSTEFAGYLTLTLSRWSERRQMPAHYVSKISYLLLEDSDPGLIASYLAESWRNLERFVQEN